MAWWLCAKPGNNSGQTLHRDVPLPVLTAPLRDLCASARPHSIAHDDTKRAAFGADGARCTLSGFAALREIFSTRAKTRRRGEGGA